MRARMVLLAITGCASAHPVSTPPPTTTGSATVAAGSAAPSASPPEVHPPRLGMFGANVCAHAHGPASVPAFEKACAAKDANGCLDLALQYRCGAGVTADLRAAARYSAQACELGAANGCASATQALIDVNDATTLPSAIKYAELGCKLHDIESCGYIGLLYWQGIGVPADPARAATIFDGQCKEGNQMSCANLAVELFMGQGVPRDVARSKTLAEPACAAGMQAACNILGGALIEEGGPANLARAFTLFQGLCEQGAPIACDNLGQMYAHGMGVPAVDKEHARAAFQKACDLGNGPGCTHLGEL